MSAFDREGVESLCGSEAAGRRRLPPAMRRLVVDLKAEHPALDPSEVSRICYARFGRRPDERTVGRVLEEPVPLRMIRRFPPYREIPEARERRAAVVAPLAEGWTAKAIASYLGINRDTACVALKRWIEEGEGGLEDRKRGRPGGVRKVDMRAIAAVRTPVAPQERLHRRADPDVARRQGPSTSEETRAGVRVPISHALSRLRHAPVTPSCYLWEVQGSEVRGRPLERRPA